MKVSKIKGVAENLLDHNCQVDFESPTTFTRLTGIICTIGPTSRSVDVIQELIAAGMNIARLNLSHGSYEYHVETIQNIREAERLYSEKVGSSLVRPIAIAIDTKGPEIRTGFIEGSGAGEVELKYNDVVNLTTNTDFEYKERKDIIYVDYANIINVMKPGDKVLIDDGRISLIVNEISGDTIVCTVENGGFLGPHRNVNLPGVTNDLPAVSESDKVDLKFCLDQKLDMIFASLIQNADALKEIRRVLGNKGKNIKIVSKVESLKSVNNLDEIITFSDGIMISRKGIGIEFPVEKIFLAQKALIARCNKAGKPVICSAQILESMIKKPRPTRIEIYDVANIVLDGVDCIMLSGETSNGMYPVESTWWLDNICKEAESAVWYKHMFHEMVSRTSGTLDAAQAVAMAAVETSVKIKAAAIIVLTTSGRSAYLVSKYRPQCAIITITRFPQTGRQVHLCRGTLPYLYLEPVLPDWLRDVDARVQFGIEMGKKHGLIQSGDPVVVVTGWKQGSGFTNTMRIVYAFFGDDELGQCVFHRVPKDKFKNKHCRNIPK